MSCAYLESKNLRCMPIVIIKWIYNRLQCRSISIHFGDIRSRRFPTLVGTLSSRVILFRLHVRFLPYYFSKWPCMCSWMIYSATYHGRPSETTFSKCYRIGGEDENCSRTIRGNFADDNILPVNSNKTKALLFHSVQISTKLGWGDLINDRI